MCPTFIGQKLIKMELGSSKIQENFLHKKYTIKKNVIPSFWIRNRKKKKKNYCSFMLDYLKFWDLFFFFLLNFLKENCNILLIYTNK